MHYGHGKMNEQNNVDRCVATLLLSVHEHSSSVDTIIALSFYMYKSIVYIYNIKYEHPLICENKIREYCVNLQSAKL